jgi:hypothetical protein
MRWWRSWRSWGSKQHRKSALPVFELGWKNGNLPDPENAMRNDRFSTSTELYPFYPSEHANRVSGRLHFTGTSIARALLVAAVATQTGSLVAPALAQVLNIPMLFVMHASLTRLASLSIRSQRGASFKCSKYRRTFTCSPSPQSAA